MKPALPKVDPPNASKHVSTDTSGRESNTTVQPPAKSTILDWAAEPGDAGFYPAEKRQRGGRKKRKKNKESFITQNWDDIYDPSRPNSYEEYQHSDEKIVEIREWKDRLYAHRITKDGSSSINSSNSDGDQQKQRTGQLIRPRLNRHMTFNHSAESTAFTGLLLAPPTDFESCCSAMGVFDDATGEDNYARRLSLAKAAGRLTHVIDADSAERVLPTAAALPQPVEPDPANTRGRTLLSSAPNISRGPVRYNFGRLQPEIPKSEAALADALLDEETETAGPNDDEAPRSLRPGQKGFAERLMSKYGWTKGSGLGAGGTGIVNPLRVQIEKQKKKPDSEGGGFAGPGGRGKIIGSKKAAPTPEAEGGKRGVMSEVVILRGMLDGLDLDAELERAEDGGLVQEIGDECGEKVRIISSHLLCLKT